jgi:hypothetical protein
MEEPYENIQSVTSFTKDLASTNCESHSGLLEMGE